MQPGKRSAQSGAVKRLDAARPHAVKEGDDRRRPAAQLAQCLPVARPHRGRAGDALMRQMIHQSDEERQILGCDTLLVQGQDEIAALGGEQEIRVLHPFGDSLAGQHLAEIVQGDKGAQLVIADFGVDRHCASCALSASLRYNPAATRLVRGASLA